MEKQPFFITVEEIYRKDLLVLATSDTEARRIAEQKLFTMEPENYVNGSRKVVEEPELVIKQFV